MAEWWLMEETVGDLIARVREHLGKSQYALAAALRDLSGRSDGVPDRSMVARWETGRRIPTPVLTGSSRRRPATLSCGARQGSRRHQGTADRSDR